KIKTVIYVSCNPATLGKNLAVLLEKYNIECIKPIDMFSQTAHVETIVKLTRKR
ncbi:MAG: 23S rRNA (uracil(1939)-C(5))-methyltransferase RlmD, partial [Bacilli bacterium]